MLVLILLNYILCSSQSKTVTISLVGKSDMKLMPADTYMIAKRTSPGILSFGGTEERAIITRVNDQDDYTINYGGLVLTSTPMEPKVQRMQANFPIPENTFKIIDPTGLGAYQKIMKNGKCMEVNFSNSFMGMNYLVMAPCSDSPNQQFEFKPVDSILGDRFFSKFKSPFEQLGSGFSGFGSRFSSFGSLS